MQVKTAHMAVVTPRRCGLYETTRELVAGLRGQNIDARIVDPALESNQLHPRTESDRGALFAGIEWAKSADLLINHSGLGPLEKSDMAVIHVAHGRPRSSFQTEVSGGTPIYSYHYAKNKAPNYQSVVTFWPEHVPYLQVMWPDKPIYVVRPPVDLEAWNPNGPSGYGFGGKGGKINIVSTDAWRDDVDPFVAVNAFALWARNRPGAKLHLYGNGKIPRGWAALLKRVQDDGNLGEVKGWVTGLEHVYRAASALITPHTIMVRSIREALACGCPVAQITDPARGGKAINDALNYPRQSARIQAETRFDSQLAARDFNAVIFDVIEKRRAA